MNISSLYDKVLNRGYIRMQNKITKAPSKDLKDFTKTMIEQGYKEETYRECSSEEVNKYLQAMNGIFPKTQQMSVDKNHQYTFMQAHGSSQIYDQTDNKEIVAIIESARK